MRRKRILTIIIGCLLTFLTTRTLIAMLAGDFAYSVIPGWHTVIYPPEMTLTVLTGILLGLTLIVVGIYKAVSILISLIFDRIEKGTNSK